MQDFALNPLMPLFVTLRHTENLNSSLTHTLIFSEFNQQDATFHNLFISVRRSACFRRFSVHHQELKTAHIASGMPEAVCAGLSISHFTTTSVNTT